MKRNIIITGGLGYIGTELCKIYSGYAWNDNITVIDNRFISERVNQLRSWNINFIHGDILDKDLVKKLLVDLTSSFPEILKNPKPFVIFNDFGDNALDLKLAITLNNSFAAERLKSRVRFKINEVFKTHNIEIPFPQRTVWINQVEPHSND